MSTYIRRHYKKKMHEKRFFTLCFISSLMFCVLFLTRKASVSHPRQAQIIFSNAQMSHLSPIKSLFILTYKKGSLKHLKIWTYTVWSATFLLKLFMFNQTVRFCCKYGGYPVVSFRFAITTHNVWFLVVRSQAQSKFLSSKTKIFYHHRNNVQNSNNLCRNRLLAFFLQKI